MFKIKLTKDVRFHNETYYKGTVFEVLFEPKTDDSGYVIGYEPYFICRHEARKID